MRNEDITDAPEGADPELWQGFLEMRRAKGKRAPFTPLAEKLARKTLAQLKALGHAPDAVLTQSIVNGWSGLFPVRAHQQALESQKPVLTGGLAHRPAAEVLGDRLDPESIRAAALANRERIEAAKRGLLQ